MKRKGVVKQKSEVKEKSAEELNFIITVDVIRGYF